MVSVAIVNWIISMFVIGSIPFFLMGINKELTEKSVYSKSKTQLSKVFIIGLIGFISLFLGSLLCIYKPVGNIVDMYDLQYRLPFVGGVGSFVLFLFIAFIFSFIITSSSDSE